MKFSYALVSLAVAAGSYAIFTRSCLHPNPLLQLIFTFEYILSPESPYSPRRRRCSLRRRQGGPHLDDRRERQDRRAHDLLLRRPVRPACVPCDRDSHGCV